MKEGLFVPGKAADSGVDDSRFELFRSLLERVLDSDSFRSSPVMRGLLIYLWRHQGESISEYAIGVEALGRLPDFDPKLDATVRVGIGRLRRKLKEVCESELATAPFHLTIPLGGHEIRWVRSPHASSLSIIRALPLSYRTVLFGAIVVGMAMTVLSSILVVENRSLRTSISVPRPESRLWRSFLANGGGKGPMIIVPSPLFFQWPDKGVTIREFAALEFQDWVTSPLMRQVAGQWGPPRPAQTYIPVESVKAAARIMQYLQNLGQRPVLTDSLSVSMDTLSSENTIFLGSSTGDRVKQILKHTNFYLKGVLPTIIGNRRPGPGEMSDYREVALSGEHKLLPELVILSPESPNRTRSLLLLGTNSSVYNLILLTPDGLKVIDDQLNSVGFPDSWEMLIQAETNGETVLKIQPLAIRRLTAGF